MPINVFELTGYTPNLFQYELLNIVESIDTILSEKIEDDWDNPIFYAEPETPKPWVEYYRQSAIKGELLAIEDIILKDHWKEYHSWADDWDWDCKKKDMTEWCYCKNNRSSAKCSQW